MRAVLKFFVITGLVLVILIPAGLVLMVIDPHPHVRATDRITQEDIQRARQILTPFKPENPDSPQHTSLAVSENDLNLLLAYGLTQAVGRRDWQRGSICNMAPLSSMPPFRFRPAFWDSGSTWPWWQLPGPIPLISIRPGSAACRSQSF
jgi:hypothetical protein